MGIVEPSRYSKAAEHAAAVVCGLRVWEFGSLEKIANEMSFLCGTFKGLFLWTLDKTGDLPQSQAAVTPNFDMFG